LGRGRREEEERWEESFYSLTYLPKMDVSFALAIFVLGVNVAGDHMEPYTYM
jgi:hypothetical protein